MGNTMKQWKRLGGILGCALLLAALSACDENGQSHSPVDVVETHITAIPTDHDNALQTRYGKVETARSAPDMPNDSLTLDGKEMFRDEGFFVSIQYYIQQEQRDLVLFGANCGGSGCPESHYQFLILDGQNQPKLVANEDFYALPGDVSIETNGLKILLDLGFEAGKHKRAVLEGDKLSISLETAPKEYLGDEKCQWLHTDALSACTEYRDVDPKCAEPQSEFAAYLSRGVAAMADFPGFDGDAFDRHCLSACETGQPAPFETFAKEVCSKQ
jgi:hypothetical protein